MNLPGHYHLVWIVFKTMLNSHSHEHSLIEKDNLGDWSPEKDCGLTLKMASSQVVETKANNSPSQYSNHPDDLFQLRYVTPGFKPFS